MLSSFAVNGVLLAFCDTRATLAPEHWTSKRKGKPAIERAATRDAFAKAGVVALVGDWTRRDPVITRVLVQHGAAGVPLYLWYAPGKAEPEELPQILTPGTLISRARQVGR